MEQGEYQTPHTTTYAEQAKCGLAGGGDIRPFNVPTAVAFWVVFWLVGSVIS